VGQAVADPDMRLSAANKIMVPDGVAASYAVYDRQKKRYTALRNPHQQFRSASIVKLLIALDYLTQHHPELVLENATTDEQRLEVLALRTMLRGSWDYAASLFWVKDGYNDVIQRMVALIGLRDTEPPQDRKFWGYTATSATDVVKTYNYILDRAPAEYREFIMGNLHASTRCAEDSRDQSFGIPSGYVPPWAVKQGWSGWGVTVPKPEKCSESRVDEVNIGHFAGELPAMKEPTDTPDLVSPLLHTTGTLGAGERNVVVLFTTYPAKTTWRQGASVITKLAQHLKPFIHGVQAAHDQLGS